MTGARALRAASRPGRISLGAVALAATAAAHLAVGGAPGVGEALTLLLGREPNDWPETLFLHATAPRTATAAAVGAALGVAGAALQLATRNVLVSPLTIGASSGAWFSLVLATVVAPAVAAAWGTVVAMAGAATAALLALAIAGPRGPAGPALPLAGMAVNLLFGALATCLLLLNQEATRGLFVWGAGDLTQSGWNVVHRLAPQVLAVGLAALALARPLELLRLGPEAAAGRGLSTQAAVAAPVLAALWLTAVAVASVGVIGFVGLLAPHVARGLGARRAADQLLGAGALGATLLLATDALAVAASGLTRDLVPSGAATALIGAPALALLLARRRGGAEPATFSVPTRRAVRPKARLALVAGLAALAVTAALLVGPGPDRFVAPGGVEISLRWPRVALALGAGAAMAVSGAMLQRLLANPLASPDVVGVSSGAALAVVAGAVWLGTGAATAAAPLALVGASAALGLLALAAGPRRRGPATVALIGVSIAALMEAGIQTALARGGDEAYLLLGWLAGSTFRATPGDAALALATGAAAVATAALLHRPLTLLSLGAEAAEARGLPVGRARLGLLAVAGAPAALATALVGPVAFVGLASPHMAGLLGLAAPRIRVAGSAAIGGALLVSADWLGRTALHPHEIPAGAVAAVGGAASLCLLLASTRRSA